MPSGGCVWLLIAGTPCSLCLVTPPSPLGHPEAMQPPGSCISGGAAASPPPVTTGNLLQPAPPSSHPLGGIRRELTAQTPRLQRGEGKGEEAGVERPAWGWLGFSSLLLLHLAHGAQPWGPSTCGQTTWVWHAWWGLSVGRRSQRPGWTASQNQCQKRGVSDPALSPHPLPNACALSANTTASPGPSTSPTCSRMKRAGCCAPSSATTCAPSAVPPASAPTPAASARSPARATPPSTATPPGTRLARSWSARTRRGRRTLDTDSVAAAAEVPKVPGSLLELLPLSAAPLLLPKETGASRMTPSPGDGDPGSVEAGFQGRPTLRGSAPRRCLQPGGLAKDPGLGPPS